MMVGQELVLYDRVRQVDCEFGGHALLGGEGFPEWEEPANPAVIRNENVIGRKNETGHLFRPGESRVSNS